MRPVARIAQSVEQGIENPRVLGSIPSPGTTIQKNPLMAGFLLSGIPFNRFYLLRSVKLSIKSPNVTINIMGSIGDGSKPVRR